MYPKYLPPWTESRLLPRLMKNETPFIDNHLATVRITINFTHFDIEGNNQDCEYDSLTISSKMGSEEARNHGLFCGNKLPPVSWASNPASFNFKTEMTQLSSIDFQ